MPREPRGIIVPVRTAAQRRKEAKITYNAFLEECPSRQLFDTLSDKWVGLVLVALADGSLRHGEIARRVAGVSQKMLTQTLRSLERDGLVSRTATPTVPVTVSYELTGLGLSLHQLMRAVKTWAELNMDDVLAHRATYDDVP